MSRHFVGNSTDGSVEINVSPIITYPLTVAAWAFPANNNVFKEVVNISDKDDTNNWLVRLALDNNAHVSCYARDSGTNDGGAITTNSYQSLAWCHVAGVFTSAGRSAYLHGEGKVTNSVAKAPTGVDRLAIGRAGDSTPSDPMAGWIADVAIWNVALTDTQIWMLARGCTPYEIGARPYLYFPLGRGTEYDDVQGTTLLPVGTLSYPTPAFRPPAVRQFGIPRWQYMDVPAAAAGGGDAVPVCWAQYRTRMAR
jgi:hypothetical protein